MAIKKQVDDFQAKKVLLENKVTSSRRLKLEQKGPVHMLDEISKALPDFVWLTAMDQAAASEISSSRGRANGLTAVADFISALQRSGWFPMAELGGSQAKSERRQRRELRGQRPVQGPGGGGEGEGDEGEAGGGRRRRRRGQGRGQKGTK